MILEWLHEAQDAGAGLGRACIELGLNRRTIERWRQRGAEGGDDRRIGPKSTPANKLSAAERAEALKVVNSSEYRDKSPKQIVPLLADKGRYIASESTLYRILHEEAQLTHRGRAKPRTSQPPAEQRATGPGQVWSWDITYLRSPVTGQFYYLYLFLDVWSRKIVAHQVHDKECTDLAAQLLQSALREQALVSVDLVLHSDNGAPMRGATMKATMERLGVIASFSRPHVSDDNPFSEAVFRTCKYWPQYPSKPFDSLEHARSWSAAFEAWYNHQHLHSGIGFVSPSDRHEGRSEAILEQRKRVYEKAKKALPHRWTGRPTRTWAAPADVWLNPTKDTRLQNTAAALAA